MFVSFDRLYLFNKEGEGDKKDGACFLGIVLLVCDTQDSHFELEDKVQLVWSA